MTAHTPGPWSAFDDEIVADRTDQHICTMPLEDGITPTEWQANLRLIAAAPELLAGLKHVEVCASCAQADWSACPGGRQALAAIAKAEAR